MEYRNIKVTLWRLFPIEVALGSWADEHGSLSISWSTLSMYSCSARIRPHIDGMHELDYTTVKNLTSNAA